MKINSALLVALAIAILSITGCEKVINIGSTVGTKLTVSALATPDTALIVSVSRSFGIDSVPRLKDSYTTYWDYVKRIQIDSTFYTDATISSAQVVATVNGSSTYTLRYDPAHSNYVSTYVPHAGDHICLAVSAPGYAPVSASTTVPARQSFSVIAKQRFFQKKEMVFDKDTYPAPLSDVVTDTAMRITMRINDAPGIHNFYRLRVRSMANSGIFSNSSYINFVSDIFWSSDVLLTDNQLTHPFGGWRARLTNLFDDHLFSGSSYDLTVETQMRYGPQPRVVLEL